MCEFCEKERERLMELALDNPMPCIICGTLDVIGAATWTPDASTRLAAGGTADTTPILSFSLCEDHATFIDDNPKAVKQAVLRALQAGQGFKI